MANTLIEPILVAEPFKSTNPPSPRNPAWRAWANRFLLLLLLIWLADAGISLLIQHTTLKGRLTSRLCTELGRNVEVGSYSFSVWSGPTLKAYSVVVADDARFGEEYFLRAQSLTVRIAWRSLFTGHLELGTVSLSQPTLNLVRDANGDWNLAEWLPRPANLAESLSPANPVDSAYRRGIRSVATPSVRFHRIDVEDGRVNFKRGNDKLPFAFSGINGTLETEASGRWRLDLIAKPSRAAAIVQQPGTLHLVGHVGGTSSRLRPALLHLDWTEGTVPDVFRLLEGRDYGVRGNLALSVSARTEGDSWVMEGTAALAQLHRWDLAFRADNPSASVVVKGKLNSNGSSFELTDARIDTPRSSARVLGVIGWSQAAPDSSSTQLRIVSADIGAADLLSWARAFRPNIAENLSINGFGHAELNLSGWPPRIEEGIFDFPRAELSGTRLHGLLRAGPIEIRSDAKGISLAPVTVTLGSSGGSLRVDGSANRVSGDFTVHVQGSTLQARDAISVASQFGWNVARGWDIAGPARCDLRWQGRERPWHSELAGTIEWGTAATGASLHTRFLNLPVEQIHGRAELHPSSTHVTLSGAQAFDANWSGTLDHDLSDGWRFSLSADDLSAANLDRWLNPLWRESFLNRILPFLNSRGPAIVAGEGVRARGHLVVDKFELASLTVRRLQGDLSLDDRHVEFSNLEAHFEDGELRGSLVADLVATPKYEAAVDFSRVDIRTLTSEFPSLANLFGGSASGKIAFTTEGANRGDLLSSLECRGNARVTDGFISGIPLPEATSAETSADPPPADVSDMASAAEPRSIRLHDASASFGCGDGKVQFQDLLLRGTGSGWGVTGTVDYSRNLDLRLRPVASDSVGPRIANVANAVAEEYRITGSLKSPQIRRISRPASGSEAKP